MTLRESASVLLIIGQAVVGPVETQWVKAPETNIVECSERLGRLLACLDRPMVLETPAETCARAMKGIGAKEEPLGYTGGDKPVVVMGSFVQGERVRCIPAPSGLKR